MRGGRQTLASRWGDMWQGVYVEGAGAVMDLVCR